MRHNAQLGYFDMGVLGDIGFGSLGVVMSSENERILRTFVPSLPSPADLANSAVYNAVTYVIGPGWPGLDTTRRAAAFRDRNVSRQTWARHVPAPSRVAEVQRALGRSADGKLGPGTAAAITARLGSDWWSTTDWDSRVLAGAKATGPKTGPKTTTTAVEPAQPDGSEVPPSEKLPNGRTAARGGGAGFFAKNQTLLIVGGVGLLAVGAWMAFRPTPKSTTATT